MIEKSNQNTSENERIKDLESYGIIDTPEDASFDRITKLASSICGSATALITFIERERVWIKSSVGFGDIKEGERKTSFCTHAIKDDVVMEIKDARLDERFKNNIWVTSDPGIRFYAGAPLVSPHGHKLGTICVFGNEPRQLSEDQLEALKILSGQVIELIELRKLNRELAESKKVVEEQQQLLINRARLQTIGELAGGVCHQINNPLAIIVGRSMILRSQLKEIAPTDSNMFRDLDIIDQTSQRVSGILKALRVYAKDLGQEVGDADLSEVIEDALTLIRPKFKALDIDLKYEKSDVITVKMNKNQISQVILDLLTNAVEAMEESEKRVLSIEINNSPKNVIVSISDTGKGIRAEDHLKIFEAFFTTKSRHFGVGLSNALNYMNQHKGEIRLVKVEGPTVFRMTLPKSA